MQFARKYRSTLILGAGVAVAAGTLAAVAVTDVLAPINGPKSIISETYPDRSCAVRWYIAEIDKEARDDLRFGYMEARGNDYKEAKVYDFAAGISVISDSSESKEIGTLAPVDPIESPMRIRLPNSEGEYDIAIFVQKDDGRTETARRSIELEKFYPIC